MSCLNIHKMSDKVEHQIEHFRCSNVVKPLPGPPYPLLKRLKEACNFIKNSQVPGYMYSGLTMWFRMSRTPFLSGTALLDRYKIRSN